MTNETQTDEEESPISARATWSRVPWIDPTPNVIAQFKAEAKRQDDLRESTDKLFMARQECTREIIVLRAEFQRAVDTLRDNYARQLAEAETKRIDAVRTVDVQNAQIDRTRASEQATTLAAQVAATAEAARNQTATMAAQVTTNFQQVTNELSQRLRVLEQISSQSVGKQTVADPALMELQASVKTLAAISQVTHGKGEGFNQAWAIVAGAAVIAMGVFFGFYNSRPSMTYGPPPASANLQVTPK